MPWETKPSWKEIRHRISDPGICGTRYGRKKIANGVSLLVCMKKDGSGWINQALRFDKSVFPTIAKAKAWYNENWKGRNEKLWDMLVAGEYTEGDVKVLGFEVKEMAYECVCPDCGEEMESEKFCDDVECPDCGAVMQNLADKEDVPPYVLGKEAVESGWIPPSGFSTLPKNMEGDIPERYHFWKVEEEDKRKELRDGFVKDRDTILKVVRKFNDLSYLVECAKGNSFLVEFKGEPSKEGIVVADCLSIRSANKLEEVDFVLMHHYWKGVFTALTGGDVEHFDLFLGDKQFVMVKNPVLGGTNLSVRRPYSKGFSKRGLSTEFVTPGSPGNPSVDGSRLMPIFYKDKFSFEKIEDVYEMVKHDGGAYTKDGEYDIINPKYPLMTFGYDVDAKVAKWSAVKGVLKHNYTGEMVEISQNAGRTIVTSGHSVYDSNLEVVAASTNPRLFQLPNVPTVPVQLEPFWLKGFERDYQHDINRGSVTILSKRIRGRYTGEFFDSLASFTGAALAEGSLDYDGVRLCMRDEEFAKDVASDASKILTQGEIKVRVKVGEFDYNGKMYRVNAYSRALQNVFSEMGKSDTRKVPEFVFHWDGRRQSCLLKSYLRGDGHKDRQYGTISPYLSASLDYLFKIQGRRISKWFQSNESKKDKPSYRTYLTSRESSFTKSSTFRKFSVKNHDVYDLMTETNNFVDAEGFVLLHNTKNTASYVKQLDSGRVSMFEDGDDFKRLEFRGKRLKGLYQMVKPISNKNLWKFGRVKNDSVKVGKLSKNMVVKTIHLSGKLQNVRKLEDGTLEVESITLGEGVWNCELYSKEAIADRPERILGTPVFVGVHSMKGKHGETVDWKLLNGRDLWTKDHIVHEEGIRKLESGDYKGPSVEVRVVADEERHIIHKILKYDRVVYVEHPACEVCKVE